MVIGIQTNFFKIIMFATDTYAFLAIRNSFKFRIVIAKEYGLKLIHPSIYKQDGGVIDWSNGSTPDKAMIQAFEVF